MGDHGLPDLPIDLDDPRTVDAYDELPLWSAMFGLLLLDEVPLRGAMRVLDVGCGTGFPLIELAGRLGPDCEVAGVDPWAAALRRARDKIEIRGLSNVKLHEGVAASLPFPADTFDLIVSNLGVNNFEDPGSALAGCARVLRPDGVLALTTNLQGHMHELYAAFERVCQTRRDAAMQNRLEEHVAHRTTIPRLRALLNDNGFQTTRVIEREATMRFRNGSALLRHYFIRLGFLGAWKAVAGELEREVFAALCEELNRVAERTGELRLTIPMAYVESRKRR